MIKAIAALLVAGCIAALAFMLLRPQEQEVELRVGQDSSVPPADRSPSLLQRTPGLPSRGGAAELGIAPPTTATTPTATGEPDHQDEAEALAALIRATHSSDRLKVRKLLERLSGLRTQAACDALLALLRDRCQLAGNEGEWAHALAAYPSDTRVDATMRDVLVAASAQGDFSFCTDARLWAVALPARDEGQFAHAERLLAHASPAHAPAVRCAILDALPRADTPELLRLTQEALRENSTSVSAYRLLLRTGDETSLDAAYESLRPGTAAAMQLAPEFGAAATDSVIKRLRDSATESAAASGLYAAAVSGMAPDRVRGEAASLTATLSRAFADARGRTDLEALLLRKHAALAIERIAPLVASQRLVEILEAEVQAGGSTARYAAAALAKVKASVPR